MLDEPIDAPPPPARRPREWRRAFRALRTLLRDPDATMQAFEIFDAIDREVEERAFRRLRIDPTGARLLATRPSLPAALADRAALGRMPEGSFGRAYLAYLDATGFHPHGLLHLKTALEERLRADGRPRPQLDPAREWFRERSILTHDLWHVLTGYGTDDLGEAVLLPFSLAQTGGYANALLVAGVLVRGTMLAGLWFARYLYEGWRRGRRTPWLGAAAYEELLPRPLDEVRRSIGLPHADEAHRGGIRQGTWSRPPLARVTTPPAGAAA